MTALRPQRHSIAALAALTLLFPPAAGAQDVADVSAGFDAESISRFIAARKKTVPATGLLPGTRFTERRERLHDLARRIRQIGFLDPASIERTFAQNAGPSSPGLLASPASRRTPEIWRYFFHGALVHIGRIAAPVSLIGFYNPFIDGWVMANCRWIGSNPALLSVRVLSGEAVRGQPVVKSSLVAWGRSARAPAELRGLATLGAFAFARAHPVDAITPANIQQRSAEQRAVVEARLLGALRNLTRHMRAPGYLSASEAFVIAARAGDAAAIGRLAPQAGAQAAHTIAGLPSLLRTRLELSGHYPTPSGAILTFAAAPMPRWVVMALVQKDSAGNPPSISRITVVDLAPGAAATGR